MVLDEHSVHWLQMQSVTKGSEKKNIESLPVGSTVASVIGDVVYISLLLVGLFPWFLLSSIVGCCCMLTSSDEVSFGVFM